MRISSKVCVLLVSVGAFLASTHQSAAEESLKILLVTGGCCHDYEFQSAQLEKAFEAADVDAEWTVVNKGGKGTKAQIELYQDPNWADGFDVVIHNECFAETSDAAYISKITDTHRKGMPAVVIHCAMHTYRAAETDQWRELLGVTSRRHDHQSNYEVKVTAPDHPIMKGFPADWKTPVDELYIIEKEWPNTVGLATADRESDGKSQVCFWVNQFGDSRVFGTTFGHSNETFEDPVFVGAVVRGTLWAADKLDQ